MGAKTILEAADIREWISQDVLDVAATVAPRHLTVWADKKLVTNAPTIEPDGELIATEEPVIFEHYGLHYTPGAAGERRLARR